MSTEGELWNNHTEMAEILEELEKRMRETRPCLRRLKMLAARGQLARHDLEQLRKRQQLLREQKTES